MTRELVEALAQAGRAHCRDVLRSASKVVKADAETKTADAVSTLSTALQLTVSTALVDGYDPHEAYDAAGGFLAWLVCRLPAQDRLGVLTALTTEVVNRIKLVEAGETMAVN